MQPSSDKSRRRLGILEYKAMNIKSLSLYSRLFYSESGRASKTISSILCFVLLAPFFNAFAFETDQYNLPPVPLADIGDEVADYVKENVKKAVEKINAEIFEHQTCLEKNSKKTSCESTEKEKLKLKYLRSADAPAREVFKLLGGGIPPFTNSGTWMEKHEFKSSPARYKTSFDDSIFKAFPSDYLTISETVNLYGVQFGTDKIAHIFQQGYTYYKIYERAEKKNLSPERALQKAVDWGRMTEKTYYGFLISGVFSNGDLAANYAGMKFYQGLTRETKFGDKMRPAILILDGGAWKFNERTDLRENLLKPFISNHLNEALNPSIFIKAFWFDSRVRKTVKERSCNGWRKEFPNHSKSDFAAITESLKLWHGENYGHKNSDHFITIADVCYDENN